MEQFAGKMTNLHYSFRNRMMQLRTLMNNKNLDGILIIISYDSLNSSLIHRLTKWLLFGHSSHITLEEKSIPSDFNETFLLITKTNLYIFSLKSTSTYLYELTSKVCNVEMYITTREEEGDSEKLQLIKIAKFIQWTYQVKAIGIPLLYEEKHHTLEIEKWPLVASTGLDVLKEGFFTMNHDIVDINKELDVLYQQIDLGACVNFISVKADMIEATMTDFYAYFEREPINKRLERSEENINQNQYLELIRLDYKKKADSTFAFLRNLPSPKLLFGVNSNKDDTSTESLYKYPFDFNFPGYHMTYENFDPITGIRIGRTIFLYTLQKAFLDLNTETSNYEFIPAVAYKEALYLFSLYHILVVFSRDKQFDIILGKLSISDAKKTLQTTLNTFIRDNYNTDVFDCLITLDNINIQKEEYILLNKAPISKQNKIILIRFEVKELYSAISRRSIGAILFSDSFLYCYSQLFNLTNDILPFKFLMSSYQHYKPEQYDPMQILRSASTVKIKDIDYKGLAFYQTKFNIPYLFQDSREVGLDPNQLFIFYSGKLFFFDDYALLTDDSVGKIIISFDNIEAFYFFEELTYAVFLIKMINGDSLPLSGIIKKEILIYLRGNTERLRTYGRNIIDFMKGSRIKSKVGLMSNEILFEYELAIKAINGNEYDQLNHVSNNFNLTTMLEVLNEMYEYEYLLFTNEEFYSYSEYKRTKANVLQLLDEEDDDNINDKGKDIMISKSTKTIKSKKNKLMFTFSTDPIASKDFCDKLIELAKELKYKPKAFMPSFDLFSFDSSNSKTNDNITEYYINALKEIASNNSDNKDNAINIICIYHCCSILDFIYQLVSNTQMTNFFDSYEILNISYIVNFNNYKSNRNKEPIFKDILYDDVINYTFVDEGFLFQLTIDKYSKILSLSNPKMKIYNKRSFLLNSKEMSGIFSIERINKGLLQFYFDYYRKQHQTNALTYQNIFISFKYICKKELLNKFLQRYLNEPLKEIFSLTETFPAEKGDEIPSMSNDQEYQEYLRKIVGRCKKLQTDPIACTVYGIAKVFNDLNKEEYCFINANYKEINLLPNKEEEKGHIGLFILGKNLLNEQLRDFYEKMLQTLAGEFTKKRKYRTRTEITKEERQNLNIINCNRPLPEGWYFQGAIFIDPNEEGNSEHPNIESFIEEYIELNNKAIDEHNQKIQEEIDKLLI